MAIQDITTRGARFHFLTVTGEPYYKRDKKTWHVECRCDCGTVKDFMCRNIVNGATKACGCYKKKVKMRGPVTHGMSKTSTHRSWAAMLTRCRNPKAPKYPQYGGRGIIVCARWFKFENFLADMGERPEGMTLDRKEVDGNYEPGNCKWATDEEQANNKQDSVYLEHQGRRMTVAQWAREKGFNASALFVRIKLGWSVEDILTVRPVLGRNQSSIR